jgi:glycosyltransferase involved in cell wall biosynthesis
MNNPLIYNSWKNADALIRVNEKDVPTLKIFNKNVFSITNGFPPQFKPLNKNECRTKLGLPVDKKILFSLGWLIERKGFNYLIDSIKIILGRRKDVLCFIGGKGSLRDKLQEQINDMNLQDHVKLIGFIPVELLPIWMNACDLYVLPSLNEGNPTVMFECLACGKPFIGTKVGGTPEIINNEDLGYIIEPANSDALANAIIKALEKGWDEKYILSYAKQYSWENITKQIVEIYDEVLEKK